MKSFAIDTLRLLIPERRRLWKEQEARYSYQNNLIKDYQELSKVPLRPCSQSKLRLWDTKNFLDYLNDPVRKSEWSRVKSKLEAVRIPEMTGGVNPGDQRLI